MHDLQPVTAIGGATPSVDHFAHITISERDQDAMASLATRRGQDAACHARLAQLLGAVPDPGRCVFADPLAGFWIGPDQWMITGPQREVVLADDLKGQFGKTASITEQTGAWVTFDLVGAGTAAVLERLCAVPVRQMARGDAQRSVIHQLGCFVLCVSAGEHMRIVGPRSAAQNLQRSLRAAALATG